ncbi:lipocalin family protein [Lacinutrix neustonica]|uniref:Lipocalin family protein n=1 Tax=Lacinutrix neustonica TaxID=2980107 RepID=A0A9E8MZU7_9FLAO|nr:lipocalin family protein [Lacinutrix neustonica]WAC03299.1 lipocalin family protein [Lacinutrix neustonica]
MKHLLTLLVLTLLLTSCSKNPEQFIEHLNGYWEIESVTLADGTKKEYTVNETIDFITITDSLKGFRKKMQPRFDGKYDTSHAIEALELRLENDSLNIYYTTQYDHWKETVLMANTHQLQIVNQNNIVYLYKRFTPITTE